MKYRLYHFCLQDILEVYFCEKTEKRKFYVGSGTADAVIAHGYYEYVVSGFFVHNRAWLTAAAYEAAVSGSMEGYKKEANIYETADIQGRMLGSQGLPGGENLSMQTNAGKNVQVTYRMEIPAVFLGQKWNITVSGTAKPLRPVGWIRRIKGAADALKEVKN